jgi:hypothetical protein
MAHGFKTGGRQKGTPNKATAKLKEQATKLCPEMLRILGKLARNEKIDAKVRKDAATTILEFVISKPKELHEHSGPDGDPIPVSVDVHDRIRAITERLRNSQVKPS